MRCITLVRALEARLPTGCHSRSPSPRRKSSPRCSRRRARYGTLDEVAELPSTADRTSAACGSCRSRGRTDRVHRSLENAQTAFPTASTGLIHHDLFKELILPNWYKGMRFDDRCVAADAPGVISTARIAGRELAARNRSARFPAPVHICGRSACLAPYVLGRTRPALRNRQPLHSDHRLRKTSQAQRTVPHTQRAVLASSADRRRSTPTRGEAGTRPEPIPRGDFPPSDPWCSESPAASGAEAYVVVITPSRRGSGRVRAQRAFPACVVGGRRTEPGPPLLTRLRRPARGSRPRPEKAGTASAAAESDE